MKKLLMGGLAGGAGGLAGGALVGLAEAVAVFVGDPVAGAWAPLYGVLFYAALLLPAGIGAGLLAGIVAHIRKWTSWTPRWAWTVGLIASILPVALVVARFRVIRDIFHEKLAIASGAGIGVHLGLLVFGAALGLGLFYLTRPNSEKGLAKVSWPVLTGAALALMVVIALPFGFLGGESPATTAPKAGAEGPPVILIMIDTLRADRLPSYGYAKNKTPHLSKFADEAVQFDHTFAPASWTWPSTASLLTSLPPSAHKTMFKADRLPDEVVTVAEAFSDQGYATGGLVTNYNIAPYFNFQQGFDSYRYLTPEFYFWAGEGGSKLSLYNLARVIREKVAPSNDNPAHYYQDAETTTDEVIGWVAAHKDSPFFLYVSYMDPHDPYFARPLSGEAYSRAAQTNPDPSMVARFSELYDGEIAYWDEHFGRLVAHLKAQGIYDEAVIVVTSDHGEEFQEHGGWWHGTTLYEEQIHVPLIVKLPKSESSGYARDDLASLVDVAPTLIGAAGLKTPGSWKGRDLFSETPAPDAVFTEEDHQGNVLRALRGRQWKIIEANEGNPRGLAPVELFNLEVDPGELANAAEKDGEVLGKMRAALDAAGKGALEGAVERDQLALDESSRERLKSLGYIEDDDDKKSDPPKDVQD